MPRKCAKCGSNLSQYNPGVYCCPCQKKMAENHDPGAGEGAAFPDRWDAEELAGILGLRNAESVKRAAREGRLPARIPGIRKCFWLKPVIDSWIKADWQPSPSYAEALTVAQGLGWDIRFLTDYGTDPQKLIRAVEDFRKSQDRRGWL